MTLALMNTRSFIPLNSRQGSHSNKDDSNGNNDNAPDVDTARGTDVGAAQVAAVRASAATDFGNGKIPVADIRALMDVVLDAYNKNIRQSRAYQQMLRNNASKMTMEAFKLKMTGLEKDCDSKKTQAWGQVISGGLKAVGGAVSCHSTFFNDGSLQHITSLTDGAGGIYEGSMHLRGNETSLTSQKEMAEAEYGQGTAEHIAKRGEEARDGAQQQCAARDQYNNQITQLSEKLFVAGR